MKHVCAVRNCKEVDGLNNKERSWRVPTPNIRRGDITTIRTSGLTLKVNAREKAQRARLKQRLQILGHPTPGIERQIDPEDVSNYQPVSLTFIIC